MQALPGSTLEVIEGIPLFVEEMTKAVFPLSTGGSRCCRCPIIVRIAGALKAVDPAVRNAERHTRRSTASGLGGSQPPPGLLLAQEKICLKAR